MRRWLAVVALLLTAPLAVWAGNTLGTGQEPSEREQAMGAMQGAYIASGCLPTLPGGSLSFGAFACTGFVHETTVSPPRLKPVVQVAKPLGPLNDGNGTYWLAIHKDTSTAASGWTRETGTHYLWRFSASQPETPAHALLFARVTVSGGGITAVEDRRVPASHATSGVYAVTDPLYGGVCDGVADTTAAIQAALDAVPTRAVVQLPEGTCRLSDTLTIRTPLKLQGTGLRSSILLQTVPDKPVLNVAQQEVTLMGFAAKHSVAPVEGGDGIVTTGVLNFLYFEHLDASYNWRGFVLGAAAYANGDHLTACCNNSHGFQFVYDPGIAAQWDISDSVSQLNKGVGFGGFNTTTANAIGPFLSKTTSFGNDQGGYVFAGSAGHPINDIRLSDVLSSADNVAGIYFDTFGFGHLISNPWIELTGVLAGFPIGFDGTTSVASNTGHCLAASSNNLPGLTITGGTYWNCAWSGVAIESTYASLSGGSSFGNGIALHADLSKRAGVHIGGNGVAVSGHAFANLGAGATLHYIHLGGDLTSLAIGQNSYDLTITVNNIIATTGMTVGSLGTVQPGGLMVLTNRVDSIGLTLADNTAGVTPNKVLRVAQGQLQVLNSAGSGIIQALSDVGTPSWPNRRGQVSVENAETTKTVTLSPVEPDTTYFVQLTPVQTGGTPAAGAYTITGVTKATGTFQISVSTAPGGGNSVIYDWLVYR